MSISLFAMRILSLSMWLVNLLTFKEANLKPRRDGNTRKLKIRDATAFGTRWPVTGLGRERRSDRGKIIIKMLDARTRQRR